MASRRMIHEAVVCSDAFVEMSFDAQVAYIQLQIAGDALGFVSGVRKILRSVGVNESVIEELETAGFIYTFPSGVVLMRHWQMANTLKNDRDNKTAHVEEQHMVMLNAAKVYEWNPTEDNGIRWNPTEDNGIPEEKREEKNREEKPRGEPQPAHILPNHSTTSKPINPALDYEQRTESDDQYNGLFVDLNDPDAADKAFT